MLVRRIAASVLLALSFGCRSEPPPAENEPADQQPSKSNDPLPGLGGMGGMSPLANMFASGLQKPGPYEEPKQSAGFSADAPHWKVIELDGPIAELESFSLLGGEMATPLRKVITQLREASADPKVAGIAIRSTGLSIDMPTAQELHDAIAAIDRAKPVVCHTEGIANAAYHVFTACDRIGIAPLGDVIVTGAAATPVHVKGLLDRLGIRADFIHVGAFKGAAEPLTRTEPSAEMLQTLEAIVESAYQIQLQGLQKRGLSADEAKAAVDKAMFVADDAKAAKLVDDVATYDQFLAAQVGEQGWTKLDDAVGNPLADFGKLQRFLGLLPPERPSEPHVALVYAVGNIVDGQGQGLVGARQEIASRTLVAALRALTVDDSVKAVVLRVDSGGGSALASEQIWHAAQALGERKPLVVSMGSVAASGGYYISSPAKKIFARETTLTGSIGVVGGKIVLGDMLRQYGVDTFEVRRGARATIWSSMKPWTDDEREAVRASMTTVYERFLERVAAGRSMQRDAVHEIAQGRVWTGSDAKARGLVDELGGLDAALAEAEKLASLPPGGPLEVYPPDPTLRDLLASTGLVQVSMGVSLGVSVQTAMSDALAEFAPWTAAAPASVLHDVWHLLATVVQLRDVRVWAWTPVRSPR